ncbi:MAG: hypothetical protein N2167_05395 [Flavobacteriales bacterium]|nr:hypothetical protein [Flavobacteriales bacterium]
MKRVFFYITVLILSSVSLHAQFVGPHFFSVEKDKADSLKEMKSRGGVDLSNGITEHWFLPFRKKGDMIKVFDGEYDRTLKNAFSELQVSAFSFGLDTSQTNSVFVEVASYIPNVSVGRLSLGVQVTRAELQDSLNRSYQTLAMNKLMNGGGNFALTFSRPLVYLGNRTGSLFFTLGAALTAYTDASFMNSGKYNPGLGGQLGSDFDFRFSAPWGARTRQVGNIFRVGIKGRGLFNMFNIKFAKQNQVDEELSTSLFGQVGAYIGLFMFNFDVLYNGSTAKVFDMDNLQFRFSVTPVKF